jgi:hypothetical protein
LTRRANHWHIVIVARISKARAGKLAAGFSLAGTRERAGTRRGLKVHVRTRPLSTDLSIALDATIFDLA